jgi:adenylate cyclase
LSLVTSAERLLDAVEIGVALLDPPDLRVLLHNRRFSEWYDPPQGAVTLPELVPGLDVERARERLEGQGTFTFEGEAAVGRRRLSLDHTIRPMVDGERTYWVLESRDVSRLKELEYMLESYSRMVEKQNRTLQREKERAERLLLNIMPKKVYEEIQTFGVTTPQRFEDASILMLDFVGFTEMAETRDPAELVAELNDIFTSFDQIVEQFGCERIKTIGDAYMAVSGVPEANPDHAANIAKVALLLLRYLERRNRSRAESWRCRIGIHTGPVIGSIVGVQKYVYDIFGPAVNMACRLEALSAPMEITVSEEMVQALGKEFTFEARGEVEIRGVGRRPVHSLVAEAGRAVIGS